MNVLDKSKNKIWFMVINAFKLEEHFTSYESSAPYLLCCSDPESWSMHEIIAMANAQHKALWNDLRLGYTESYGMLQLRQQIVSSLYPNLQTDNILCLAGADEGIFVALYTLCEPQDNIIVLTPAYQSLFEIPKLKGATVTKIALREKNSWRIDVDEIKHAIQKNTKCIVINFPHNPTGQILNQSEFGALINLCEAHNLWLFSDEVYRLLGNPDAGWVEPAAEVYCKAISLGVMSKGYGMAGLRIGWLASQDVEMLQKMKRLKDYLSVCNSVPSEIIAIIGLDNSKKILDRNNKIVYNNLALLDDFILEHQDKFSWVRPQGGCLAFINYLKDEPVDIFCDRLAKQAGVMVMPASTYEYAGNYFRIGFGRKNMPELLEKFQEFLYNKNLSS